MALLLCISSFCWVLPNLHILYYIAVILFILILFDIGTEMAHKISMCKSFIIPII